MSVEIYDSRVESSNYHSVVGGDLIAGSSFLSNNTVNTVDILIHVQQNINAKDYLRISIYSEKNGNPHKEIGFNFIQKDLISTDDFEEIKCTVEATLYQGKSYYLILSSQGPALSYKWQGIHDDPNGNRLYSTDSGITWQFFSNIKHDFYIEGRNNETSEPEIMPSNVDYDLVRSFFPESYKSHADYSVLIKILAHILSIVRPQIENFNELVDIDLCPIKFLPLLGSLVGYDYNYSISSRANRFIIKNLLEAYRRRGSLEALKLVTRIAKIDEKEEDVPDAEKYYNYLFDPNIDADENRLELTRQWLFRWGNNIHGFYSSNYSTIYAYPSIIAVPENSLPGNPPIDWYYNNAVFDIFAPRITRLLRELMKWVVPAGMRIYWTMIHDMEISQYALESIADIELVPNTNFRLVFFNYKILGETAWKISDITEEDPETLFDATPYEFSTIVSVQEKTTYVYRLGIGYPAIDPDGFYDTTYEYGNEEIYVSPAYGYMSGVLDLNLDIVGIKSLNE